MGSNVIAGDKGTVIHGAFQENIKDKIPVTVAMAFSRKKIANELVSAFEGGSNYWIHHVDINPPSAPAENILDAGEANGQLWPLYDYPLQPGGSVDVHLREPIHGKSDKKKYRLNLKAIKTGLQKMADNSPRHFSDFVDETGDATTGDVLLQYCLFGEIIFG